MTTLEEEIKAIQDAADAKIAVAKERAEKKAGLVKRLSDAKEAVKNANAELAQAKAEYKRIMGKTVKGEKTGETRERLSDADKAKLTTKIAGILKGSPSGIGMAEIVTQSGGKKSSVQNIMKEIKGVTKKGPKTAMLYFLK